MKYWIPLLLASCTALAACDDGPSTVTLSLDFDGLEPLGDDAVYEGWLIVDGAPVSTGVFAVQDDLSLEPATFEVDEDAAENATAFVLTIEPAVGDVPAPSDTHVLAGDISNGNAALTVDHGAALGDDFTGAAGSFILATPSSAATDDDNLGIWFLDPSGTAPVATLSLPTLPAGWVYEGWVVDSTGPHSTGRFVDVDAADDDGGGLYAGDQPTPPFPGQDFIDPPMDLTSGFMAVISVEPDPDDSPAPFALKPLAGAIMADLAPTLQALTNNANASNPTGTASLDLD